MALIDQALSWVSGAGLILAQAAGSAPAPAGPASGAPAGTAMKSPAQDLMPVIFMIAAMVLVYTFVVIRPQKAEQKKRQAMLDQVAKGDAVVTIGGIHGKVESVDLSKGIVTVEVAPKVTMRFNKSAVSSVTPKGKPGDKEESNGKGEKSL